MKFIAMVFVVISAAFLRGAIVMVPLLYLIIILFGVSGVKISSVAKIYASIVPIIIVQSVVIYFFAGWNKSFAMFLRITVSVLAMSYVILSTELFDLMKAFGQLRAPRRFISLFILTYRSIFLFGEETKRMRTARKARGFRQGSSMFDKRTMGTLSATIGMLFVRVDKRGTAMHTAMRARGFDGHVRTLTDFKIGPSDGFAFVLIIMVPVISLMIEWGLFSWKYFA